MGTPLFSSFKDSSFYFHRRNPIHDKTVVNSVDRIVDNEGKMHLNGHANVC